MASDSKNIDTLTGIRGLAALWVFGAHLREVAAVLYGTSMPPDWFFYHGYFGVDLFFILSGFVLTHAHFDDFSQSVWKRFRYFITLRVCRIYPLHIFIMLFILGLITVFPALVTYENQNSATGNAFSFANFFPSLLLVQAWGIFGFDSFWNGPSWTLSAEFLAYLSFPFLIFFMRRIKSPYVNLGLAFALLLGLGVFLQYRDILQINAHRFAGIIRVMFGFTGGCLLNRFFTQHRTPPFPMAWGCSLGFILAAFGLYFETITPVIFAAFGLIILSLAYALGFYKKLIGSGAVFWLGQVSFSFYLTQIIILHTMACIMINQGWNTKAGNIVFLAVAPITCLIIASACYEMIEKRSRRLGRKLAAA